MTQNDNESVLSFSSCGRDWTLYRPGNLEALWDNLDNALFQEDERLPYWVELWPSSFALASWITANSNRFAGSVCLDIGCGLGFTAMVGTLAGAKVIAMDYEMEALIYASRNAIVNKIPPPLWVTMDWRFPALQKGVCNFAWGGDIMYEKRFAGPVLGFLEHAMHPEGCMWLAEPGRNVYETFDTVLNEHGWTSRHVGKEQVQALEGFAVTANIWEISRIRAT